MVLNQVLSYSRLSIADSIKLEQLADGVRIILCPEGFRSVPKVRWFNLVVEVIGGSALSLSIILKSSDSVTHAVSVGFSILYGLALIVEVWRIVQLAKGTVTVEVGSRILVIRVKPLFWQKTYQWNIHDVRSVLVNESSRRIFGILPAYRLTVRLTNGRRKHLLRDRDGGQLMSLADLLQHYLPPVQ